ncbi:Starch-binding associating with outer membrane [Flavobacterium columnare]|uniref:SusD/RagB family nutrient-binding outer membrane lipoprotein n=2 Tax=Flavobacterium TaxID=237 RepID=A0ABW8PL19_9FLAO|nr:SusD/RagB family nutrient-binding outer membrane lipoprotein [Flavobacterium columnare]SPE76434.1 Starch-binding associating with outer membrane [Flavobacterium columnare]
MKSIKILRFGATLFLSASLFIGCENYLDVDTDTDNPKDAPLSFLLTGVEFNASIVGNYRNNSGSILSTYTHSMTSRGEDDQYGSKPDNAKFENDWTLIYSTLNDVKVLIDKSTVSGDRVYLGIGQLYKAYLMSIAVDLWGDVPYTQSLKLEQGIRNPKFDNQKDIYNDIFRLIDEAKVNLASNAGLSKPSPKEDLIYGGDAAKWIRFANTFKLKLYNQVRLSDVFNQADFDKLVAENNFFKSIDDDFEFMHYKDVSPRNLRNLYYRESYESTQFGSYQSPWFYEIMKGMNPNILNGNPDPRVKYYFFNQLVPGQLPPDTAVGDDPKADYWDKSTGFFSVRFGSVGPNRDKSAERCYTYPGIFPCGGRYDDGQGTPKQNGNVIAVDDNSGTGQAAKRMLTYDEFLYIKAELISKGKMAGDVRGTLKSAVEASFAKVDQVVAKSGTTQVVPKLIGLAATNTYITRMLTEFDNGSSDKKFEIIMTQKWIGTYGDPLDQYNDYRRTGFPKLADPNSATKEYQLNNLDAWPLNDLETRLNGLYQFSIYWPLSEIISNSSVPVQKNPSSYKIFWNN